MTKRDDIRIDGLIVDALRHGRPELPEPGPARLELERRRLLARLAAGERARLFAPFSAFRPRFAMAAAAILLVAGASVALFALRDRPSVVSLSGVWKLERGDAIAQGSVIRIPDGERATLFLDDGTVIGADSGSRLRVALGPGVEVQLLEGRIAADVAKRKSASEEFVVATEFGNVAVMGTFFAVSVDEESATVRLYEGRVKLSAAGSGIALTEGHSARATKDGIASLGGLPEGDAKVDFALLASRPRAVAAQKAVAASAPPQISSAPSERGAAAAKGQTPKSEAPTRVAGARTEGDLGARMAVLWREKRYADIIAATEGEGARPEALFYRGKALGALGRWMEAASVFADVASTGGDLGRESLYLSAAAFNAAGDFEGSLEMAGRAVSSGGPNADHAARLVFVSLTGLGKYSDAAASAKEYLDYHPNGAHTAEARFAVGTGARLERRWADAADSYEEFLSLGRGTSQMRDDAAFYVGYCRLMAGAVASGRESLESYLATYPSGRHAEQARAALSN